MRSKEELFDMRLSITASMGYPFEKPFYKCEQWEKAKTIVDIGCGNADYISFLAKENPQKSFFGIEKIKNMAKIAKARHHMANLEVLNTDYKDLPEDFKFDFLIARRSIVHLNPRQDFYKWILKHASQNASILIIETERVNFDYTGALKAFRASCNEALETSPAGAESKLRELLEKEITELGFNHVSTKAITINTSLPGIKENLYVYLRLIAEQTIGFPVPSDIAEELFTWYINKETYGEQYMYGALFNKTYLI